ncbi:MAG: aldo/keto reductase [Propionibacteriaceae bacterium]|jgi:diketogulonate reductase-like aldo/keto reductase|nr:aldo/keto reductase [Propionibacteriaceae bacterium]
MTSAPAIPNVTLNTGLTTPAIGFGTWPLLNQDATEAVSQALTVGYRFIDTATKYGNETGVGRALAASGIARADLCIQTKLRGADQGALFTPRAIDASLANLGLDYLDLYLIHWPLPMVDLYVDSWQAMIAAQQAGLIRSLGVSNFQISHLERLFEATGVVPAVNQVELHPYFAQSELLAYHAEHGIVTQAWSPLGRSLNGVLDDPAVTAVAAEVGVTPAQAILAWHRARGVVPLPKSSQPARMADNLAALNVTLTPDQVDRISALSRPDGRLNDGPDEHDER